MSKTFYVGFLGAAALAALLLLPSSAMAQTGVWIDGYPADVEFEDEFLNYYYFNNWPADTATVYSPWSILVNRDTIVDATIYAGGIRNGDTIGTVTVNGGTLYNYDTIGTATINGGTLYNYDTIGTATINGGTLGNEGTITTATVNGGYLGNEGGTIDTATVDRGTFYNWVTITNATLKGGTVDNRGGLIEEMTYVAGTYNGMHKLGNTTYTGTIGTLTLAGNARNNTGDWGTIENLVFDNNGNGLITLTGSANPAMAMAAVFDGIMPAGNAALPGISFSTNITAANIDFTYGNIALDLSGLVGFSEADILSSLFAEGFLVASLFGNANVTGFEELNSFELAFASGSLFVKSGGVFANGWSFADGFITWNGGAEVPEPATLLMLGLSLAGLPIVRRLRKK